MEKSSKSSSKSVRVKPFVEEEDATRWVAGLRSCAKIERNSADKMKRGIWPRHWRAEMGMARLLEKMANLVDPRKKHTKPSEATKSVPRISDGKPSLVPRVCR